MVANKRNFRRITLRTVMTTTGIITPQGHNVRKSYQLPLEDLSAGGLRYTSKFPIPVGTRMDLVFQLDNRQVGATAEVVRAQKNPDGRYDIGCKFVGINRLDQESIVKHVTLSSLRDAPANSVYNMPPEKRSINVPISCNDCRCADCADKDACRACYKPNCGKRYCRMHRISRPDARKSK